MTELCQVCYGDAPPALEEGDAVVCVDCAALLATPWPWGSGLGHLAVKVARAGQVRRAGAVVAEALGKVAMHRRAAANPPVVWDDMAKGEAQMMVAKAATQRAYRLTMARLLLATARRILDDALDMDFFATQAVIKDELDRSRT